MSEQEQHGGERDEVPALLVEQLALGELDDARAQQLRARIDRSGSHEGGAQAAVERLEASNQEILADYPAAAMAARIRARAERDDPGQQKARRWQPYVFAPTLVAAAAVVWVMVRDPSGELVEPGTTGVELIDSGEPEQVRIKGGSDPLLVVDRRTTSGHERLGPDELVREGDQLQLSYMAAGHDHGVILSIDGAGAVTLHHPAEPDLEPRLEDGKEVPLAHSYELDDAPDYERFFFVTRDDGERPQVSEVLRAAETLAAQPRAARSEGLPLSGDAWRQQSVLLRKGAVGVDEAGSALEPADTVGVDEAGAAPDPAMQGAASGAGTVLEAPEGEEGSP